MSLGNRRVLCRGTRRQGQASESDSRFPLSYKRDSHNRRCNSNLKNDTAQVCFDVFVSTQSYGGRTVRVLGLVLREGTASFIGFWRSRSLVWMTGGLTGLMAGRSETCWCLALMRKTQRQFSLGGTKSDTLRQTATSVSGFSPVTVGR